MPDATIFTEQPHWCRATIHHGEDWYEAIPQFTDPITGDPYSLVGITFDLYIRPTYNFDELIAHLSDATSGGDGINIEDAAQGLAAIFMQQAAVDALPIGTWQQFLNITFTDPDYGAVTKTVWRGPCIIKPGNTDVST